MKESRQSIEHARDGTGAWVLEADPFASSYKAPFGSSASGKSTPSQHATSPVDRPKKQRVSLLMAATDALGFTLGRKRRSLKPPRHPLAVPEPVIEISAQNIERDEEAERERLRDAAVQALGVSAVLNEEKEPPVEDTTEDGDSLAAHRMHGHPFATPESNFQESTAATSLRSAHSSFVEVPTPTNDMGQRRSLSLRRPAPMPISSSRLLPPFPTVLSSLTAYTQTSTNISKHYTSLSPFLLLSRAKQWKGRHLVLTSLGPSANGPGSAQIRAHLHLFKSSALEDKEMERLELTEDSPIQVADEEGGGKKCLVKVGGRDAGAVKQKDGNSTNVELGLTMWLLQFPDEATMHSWIHLIKGDILMQRAERGGSSAAFHSHHIVEQPQLQGDSDAMLSLRKQAILHSSAAPAVRVTASEPPSAPVSPTLTTGLKSVFDDDTESNVSVPTRTPSFSQPSAAVHALKGLFNSTRPPSSSSARPKSPTLMSIFRPTSPQSPTASAFPVASTSSPSPPPTPSATYSLEPISDTYSTPAVPPGKVMSNGKLYHASSFSVDWESIDGNAANANANDKRALNVLSLPPPPRSRRPWTSGGVASSKPSIISSGSITEVEPPRRTSLDTNPIATRSPMMNMPARVSLDHPPMSSSFGASNHFPQPPSPMRNSEDRDRGNDLQRDRSVDLDRSSSGRRSRSITRTIPKRLSPPSGPPPSIPTQLHSPQKHAPPSPIFEHKTERPPSRSSGGHNANPTSSGLGLSLQITPTKRMSTSSARSAQSANTSSTGLSNGLGNGLIIGRAPPSTALVTPTTNGGQQSARSSLHPPPQRPTPTTAPPPPPVSPEPANPPPPTRAEYFPRSTRSPLAPPAPPPHGALPPRPDEPGFSLYQRLNTSRTNSTPSTKATIPPPTRMARTPPPPPPELRAASPLQSFSMRLRMMSAPTPSPLRLTQQGDIIPPVQPLHYSPPASPLGEPITTNLPDVSIEATTPRPLSARPERISLSPPPRRGSRTTPVPTPLPTPLPDLDSETPKTFVDQSPKDSAVHLE